MDMVARSAAENEQEDNRTFSMPSGPAALHRIPARASAQLDITVEGPRFRVFHRLRIRRGAIIPPYFKIAGFRLRNLVVPRGSALVWT